MLYIGFRLGGLLGLIVALPIGLLVINFYQAGLFESTQKSLQILITGINNFRKV
jgi:predicted PurR-regulated permease PerM